MSMHRTILALAALAAFASAPAAFADRERPGKGARTGHLERGHGYSGQAQTNAGRGYSGRAEGRANAEFERNHRIDRSAGEWFHGEHGGQQGWWWRTRGMWILAPPAPAAAPSGFWYWCPSAEGYYPDVTSCEQPWVPVAPPPASP